MFRILRGGFWLTVRKHDCCLYVADSWSFVQIDVGLFNVTGVFLLDLDVYVLARPPSNFLVQDENLPSFLSNFYIGREVIILGDFYLP